MGRQLSYRRGPYDTGIGEGKPMAPHVVIFNTPSSQSVATRTFHGRSEVDFSPGFAVTTRLPAPLSQVDSRVHPSTLQASVGIALHRVELATGRALGHSYNPLFLDITSESAEQPAAGISIRYLGINDDSVDALARQLGDVRAAWDCYRQFLQAYGMLVLGIDQALFTERESLLIDQRGIVDIDDFSAVDLQILIGHFRDVIEGKLDRPLLQDPYAQLWSIIGTAFRSGLPIWGTSIAIRAMAIGSGEESIGRGAALMSDAAVRNTSRQEDLSRH